MRTGECKFGASCKYHHPRQGGGGGGGDSVTSPISFNHMGFPLRPVCSISLSLSSLGYILISVLSYVSSLREKEMFLINGLHRVRKNVPIT